MEEKPDKKKGIRSSTLTIIGIFLIIITVVLIVLFSLNGSVTTSGNFPEDEKATSLNCTSSILGYPLFEMDDADHRNMNIKVVANGDRISTVSLTYNLYYGSEDEIRHSRDVNHYKMNKNFEEDNMEADALGANYSMMDDNFKFNLFAETSDLNQVTAKYFLLEDAERLNYSNVKNRYKSRGFKCIESD